MSHITKVDIEVRDLSALQRAAENLGLEFHEGQKSFAWWGRFEGDTVPPVGVDPATFGRCDHVLHVPGVRGAYEVGVVSQADGSWALHWDFWQGGYGLQALIGENGSKLVGEYALCAAENAAQAQGWYSERSGEALLIYHPDGGVITVEKSGTVDVSQVIGGSCVSAAAPIEQALGARSERTLKCEAYASKQSIGLGGE